jgi:hypothetical protein
MFVRRPSIPNFPDAYGPVDFLAPLEATPNVDAAPGAPVGGLGPNLRPEAYSNSLKLRLFRMTVG